MLLLACLSPTYRKDQTVRIDVLGDSDTERFRWLLNARHVVFGHLRVEFIKIWNLKTSTALSSLLRVLSLPIGRASIDFVQCQRCSIGAEFRPSR